MSLNVTFWLMVLGALLIVLPGFNVIGAGLLMLGAGNGIGRVAGPTDKYKALR